MMNFGCEATVKKIHSACSPNQYDPMIFYFLVPRFDQKFKIQIFHPHIENLELMKQHLVIGKVVMLFAHEFNEYKLKTEDIIHDGRLIAQLSYNPDYQKPFYEIHGK